VDLDFVDACKKAIKVATLIAVADYFGGDVQPEDITDFEDIRGWGLEWQGWDTLILVPTGYKVTASKIIEGLHLDAFIDVEVERLLVAEGAVAEGEPLLTECPICGGDLYLHNVQVFYNTGAKWGCNVCGHHFNADGEENEVLLIDDPTNEERGV